MSSATKITVSEFCTHHQIEVSFLHSLHEYGLIEIIEADEDFYFDEEQLNAIERLVRLHYDLQINIEGIDAVQNLLQRVEEMQTEINLLRSRLQLYEDRT